MAQQRMQQNVSVTGSVQLTDGIARAASQGGVSLASNQAHQGSQSNSVVGSHDNGYLQIQESERSSATNVVLERLKPYGASHDTYEFARTILTGPPSKGSSKIGKANGYTGVSKHGSRAVSSRVVSSKGSRPETIMAFQDITMQAQALLSIKDSNKDERERLVADASLMLLCLQSSD